MTALYRSAHFVRRILRALALVCLAEITVKSARDAAADYGWRVVALTLAMLAIAAYAFTRPVRTWGHS